VLAPKTRVVVATLVFPLLLLVACSHATQSASPPVTLGYCGSNLQVMPDTILVVCNTNDIAATSLKWSNWGKSTATAKGSATVDLCAYEDCASGDYTTVPIEMIVSKIVHCSNNARAYSTLRYIFPGGSPFQGVPADAKVNGQDQPVPPTNQTVSLTC
jgi:hypothetical protein